MSTNNEPEISETGMERPSIAFELSGESPGLAAAEASALLDLYNGGHVDILVHPLLLFSRTTSPASGMASRVGLSHNVLEIWAAGRGGLKQAMSALESIDAPLRAGQTFRVRARALGGEVRLPTRSEAELGEAIFSKGFKVDLKRPDAELRALFHSGGFVVGRCFAVDREGLRARSPRYRPFFYPGVVKPPFARALVNLCRLRTGILLDPACGTAGILVEAGLLGLTPLGIDAQPAMVAGAERNLAHYELAGQVILADAGRIPMGAEKVSGVVCDLPYGRSSRFAGTGRDELYRRVFSESLRVLVGGHRAVFCTDVDISEVVARQGLLVEENHSHRVHGSLTRHVVVCRAP